MHPVRSKLWLALHALVCALPVIAALAHAPDVELFGVEAPSAAPRWSFADWRSEKLQPALQQWFESHIGLRGVMVRTDNSAYQAVKGETSQSAVIAGNDGTLFFRDTLLYMNLRPQKVPPIVERIDGLGAHLASARRKLEARGSKLVVVIAPNKAMLEVRSVPGRYVPSERGDLQVHEALRASLTRHGLPFVDSNELFAQRPNERELLFAPTARHWTGYFGCLVLQSALPSGSGPASCAYDMTPTPRELAPDFDLYRLQNLWRFERTAAMVPVVRRAPEPTAEERARTPRTLLVGTSFMWTFAELLQPLMRSGVALYYNRSFYDIMKGQRRLLDSPPARSPSWNEFVLERDLYLVEILEEYEFSDTASFVESLDASLDGG